MTIKDENATIDGVETAPPAMNAAPPVSVDGGLGKARAWFVFGQVLAAVGAVITFMGLGEQSWVVRLYSFLHSDKAIPLVGLVLWIGGGIGLWWRAKGRQKAMAFMASLLSDRWATVQGALHPAVQASVQAAKDQSAAEASPVMESRR